MKNSLLIIGLIMIFSFNLLSPAIAAGEYSAAQHKESLDFQMNKANIFSLEQKKTAPSLSRRAKRSGQDIHDLIWLSSLFIPGLGQMLLGDVGRGVAFTLMFTLVGALLLTTKASNIILLLITFVVGSPMQGLLTFIEVFISIVLIVIYLWNIIDAYLFYEELNRDNSYEYAFINIPNQH